MRLTAALLLLLLPLSLFAQQRITGSVANGEGKPLGDVAIQNIHSGDGLLTGLDGHFALGVQAGQLVEFRKIGYKTARVRIGVGALPPYYRIVLEPGIQELAEIEVRNHFSDFKHDSLRYRELFKKQLDYQVVSGWRAIQSPFSAMSRQNRQMATFQREYAWLEQQKYVDYTFSQRLIAQLTGLKGDSAVAYIRRYRPSYEALRAMPEYDLFSYVKQTVNIWRQRQRLGPSNSRGSGGGG